MNPGILAYLGYECVNKGPTAWLGVDGREMGFWKQWPYCLRCLSRIDQIVNNQPTSAVTGDLTLFIRRISPRALSEPSTP